MKQIISFSGGKDSTAMLLRMIALGEQIDDIVFFNTGWEFPQMQEHIKKVPEFVGREIAILHPPKPFDYWLLEREVVARKGPNKGKVHRIGNGWPSPMRRWCTRIKVGTIEKYVKKNYKPEEVVMCVGFAFDEADRQTKSMLTKKYSYRYPLIEWEWTEAKCLGYCIGQGFNWDGLYDIFARVSCYCCPLQRIGELRKLRKHFPDLWSEALRKDKAIKTSIGFNGYKTLQDMDRRFAEEDKQTELFV